MKVGWGRDYYGDGERRNGREIVRFDSQDISLTKYSERLQTRNLPVMSICTVSSMNQHWHCKKTTSHWDFKLQILKLQSYKNCSMTVWVDIRWDSGSHWQSIPHLTCQDEVCLPDCWPRLCGPVSILSVLGFSYRTIFSPKIVENNVQTE